MGRTKRPNLISKALIVTLALLLILCLFGCSSGGGSSSTSASPGGKDSGSKASELNEGEPGDYKVPKFRTASFDEGSAERNDEVKVDLSSVSKGYIALIANSDKRLKLQIFKGGEPYTYDIVQGKEQIFPLQSGDGTYDIKVMKNISDNKYFELYTCQADVKLEDKFQPFTRPNQYADYDKDSKCVKKAAELAAQATCESDFISKVYENVCSSVTYDYEFAKNVGSGYIPEPDKTFESGKGICIDYACLAASMLRSQGIPTKIIFGYVAPDDLYHAWNMFYTKEEGWVTVEFKTGSKDWSRLDLTFAANGESDEFIGDGSNYQDVYQY